MESNSTGSSYCIHARACDSGEIGSINVAAPLTTTVIRYSRRRLSRSIGSPEEGYILSCTLLLPSVTSLEEKNKPFAIPTEIITIIITRTQIDMHPHKNCLLIFEIFLEFFVFPNLILEYGGFSMLSPSSSLSEVDLPENLFGEPFLCLGGVLVVVEPFIILFSSV